MCKSGSVCCGCGTTSSGIGTALAVIIAAGLAGAAVAAVSAALTAILVSVLGLAALGIIVLIVIVRRTRVVAHRPRSALPGLAIRAVTVRQPLPIEQVSVERTFPEQGGLVGTVGRFR